MSEIRTFFQVNGYDLAKGVYAPELGPYIMLYHSKLFCKPPENGAPFPIHQG